MARINASHAHRASAIYQLLVVTGSTLSHGILGPSDVQLSFQIQDGHNQVGRCSLRRSSGGMFVLGVEAHKVQQIQAENGVRGGGINEEL